MEYAKAISDFSKLESGAGQNFDGLAEFMAPSRGPRQDTESSTSQDGFVTIYQLCSQPSDSIWRDGFHNVRSFDDFERNEPYRDAGSTNHMIFLKGYPSPGWLRCIGSKYGIDPEFFRRHYEFEHPSNPASNVSPVSLLSSSWHMFKLNLTTVQVAEQTRTQEIGSEKQRIVNDAAMETYTKQLVLGNAAPGDPIVRHFSTIDATHFVIEQRISIYLHENDQNWTGKSNTFSTPKLRFLHQAYGLTGTQYSYGLTGVKIFQKPLVDRG